MLREVAAPARGNSANRVLGRSPLYQRSFMKHRNDPAPQTPADLLNDLRTLVLEAEKMLEASATEHTGEALDALRARFTAAQERLGDIYESAKKNVTAGAKYTDETIRANPYQSIAIAAGVGLLVGVLLGRRGGSQ